MRKKTPGSFKKGHKPWNYYLGRRDCDPTLIPTEIDIAWAAGIYEGEGTCQARFYSRKNAAAYWAFNCSVSQKDSWLCPKLRDLFGGGVTTFRVGETTYYRWNLYGFRCADFLKSINKYLSPRRQEQVKTVLDAANRREEYGPAVQLNGRRASDEDFLQPTDKQAVQ